jgi:hypothetical protein
MAGDNQTASYWAFPPAFNTTFAHAYGTSYGVNNETWRDETWRGLAGLVSEAISNLTLAERYDNGSAMSGFGSRDAVLRVGDVIEVDSKRSGNSTISLDCFVCTTGAEGGLIENACENCTLRRSFHTSQLLTECKDTRTANTYNKPDKPPPIAPNGTYTIPSLENYFPLENANRTCALCIVILLSEEGFTTRDYTIPFPVLQQSAYPHKRFSAEHPTGIEDTSISVETSSPLAKPAEHEDGTKINVSMVVGVVVGVLIAAVLLALLYWWLWKKRKGGAKVVNSGASSTIEQEVGNGDRSNRSVALQRIQGVVRRPDTSASEVPPPYQEAIRSGTTPESDHL